MEESRADAGQGPRSLPAVVCSRALWPPSWSQVAATATTDRQGEKPRTVEPCFAAALALFEVKLLQDLLDCGQDRSLTALTLHHIAQEGLLERRHPERVSDSTSGPKDLFAHVRATGGSVHHMRDAWLDIRR
jgi:hypothetical protein